MAQTDEQGKASLTLALGKYMVEVTKAGYATGAQPVEGNTAGQVVELPFPLVALAFTLNATVVDSVSGAPIAGADVVATPVG